MGYILSGQHFCLWKHVANDMFWKILITCRSSKIADYFFPKWNQACIIYLNIPKRWTMRALPIHTACWFRYEDTRLSNLNQVHLAQCCFPGSDQQKTLRNVDKNRMSREQNPGNEAPGHLHSRWYLGFWNLHKCSESGFEKGPTQKRAIHVSAEIYLSLTRGPSPSWHTQVEVPVAVPVLWTKNI